jgi:hypothetical protein
MPAYIPDGQTLDGYVAAALPEDSGESQHEELNFTYRPATRQEILSLDGSVRITMKNADIDPTCLYKSEKQICDFIANHVKSWDLKQVGVHPVEVTADNIERLNPYLYSKLYGIVRGTRLCDKKPDGPAPKSDDERLKN